MHQPKLPAMSFSPATASSTRAWRMACSRRCSSLSNGFVGYMWPLYSLIRYAFEGSLVTAFFGSQPAFVPS